ncbi:AAA family ATPase [Halobaculum sp. WSA2]|uniref:AAA family ATPase n=1 Tax=Halobaculum saliterrae TaxID=2073113 RepID=A0A6B0SUF3_9EURY|nr:AAA family ATPase [Halobaculum saliterrae]MXR39812.1 AAA family ATPase [Halobaculum saliterrae]
MDLISLDIQGYKSIRENQSIDIDNFTVLFGGNNVGKSSVIDALKDYREVFPVANQVDSGWAHSLNTNKELQGEIRFNLEFLLESHEHEKFLDAVNEETEVRDRDVDRWKQSDDFRKVTHELVLRSGQNPRGNLQGTSVFSAEVGDTEVDIRRGGLSNNDAKYLNFNKIDVEDLDEDQPEYHSKRRAFGPLLEILEDSMSSWTFIEAFREPTDRLEARRQESLRGDGNNLTQVLLTLSGEGSDEFERVSNEYENIMSGVEGIRAKLPTDDKTTVVVDEYAYDTAFELSEISAGSKEILTLITQIILAQRDADLLLVEEPELHLHPGAERKILDLIRRVIDQSSQNLQAVVSTHSNIFVHHLDIDNIYRVERDGNTDITKTASSSVGADLRDLGYEYAGMFQSEGVVVVEGLTDRVALKTIGRRCGFDFDEYNIGVLEMGSGSQLVKHSRPVVRLFRMFNIPYMFICDSDIGEALKKDNEDTPPSTPNAIEGRLVGHLNGDSSRQDEWGNEPNERVHAWRNEELEHYILQDEAALADNFHPLNEEKVCEILEEAREADDSPDDQLKAICDEGRQDLGDTTETMVKKADVQDISERIDLESIPDEFFDVLGQVAGLVDADHIIREERPDGGAE